MGYRGKAVLAAAIHAIPMGLDGMHCGEVRPMAALSMCLGEHGMTAAGEEADEVVPGDEAVSDLSVDPPQPVCLGFQNGKQSDPRSHS